MKMNSEKLSASAFLSAILVTSSFAGLGLTGAAFATVGNATGNATAPTGNATAAPSGNTTTAAASNMSGVIASIQQDDSGNPAWITAGHWKIESDTPLLGDNSTEPHISNFTATVYMVSNADGTAFHVHEISNFVQTDVQHQGPNATTVNGTFTVTLQEEPINDVRGYIYIVGDKIEFWVDPTVTDNHFGPSAIMGIVLDPGKVWQMKSDHRGNATMTQGANSTESWY